MNVFKTNSAYRHLTISSLFETLGNDLFNIVLLIYAAGLPNHTLALSLATIEMFVPELLQSYTGHLADRTKNKIARLLLSGLSQSVLYVGVTVVFLLVTKSLASFAIILALIAVADTLGTFNDGLKVPITKHIVAADELEQGMSFSQGLAHTVSLIAQASGAALIVGFHNNYAVFAAVNALMYVASILTILPKKAAYDAVAPVVSTDVLATKFFSSITSAVRDVFVQKNLRTLMFIFIIVNMVGGSLTAVMNLTLASLPKSLLIGTFGITTVALSFGFSAGMIIGNLTNIAFINRRTLPQLVIAALVLMGSLAVDFVTIQNVYFAVVSFAGLSFLLGNIGPKFSAMVINSLDDTHLATSLGALNSVLTISVPVTTAVLLTIANLVSIYAAWISIIVLTVVVFIATFTLSRSLQVEVVSVESTN